MAQIPSFTTSVQASSQGLGNIGVRANEDAFGANVGQANKALGAQFESAGDMIMRNALTIQGQINAADAQNANSDYVIKTSGMLAKFQTLEGKAAMDARPKLVEDLRKVREEIRGGLSNPATQRLYDASTRQQFARTVFSTATYAAREQKQYSIQSAEGRMAAGREWAITHPDDEEGFQENFKIVADNARAVAKAKGLPPEATIEYVRQQTSGVLSNRLQGLSRKDPLKAIDIYEANKALISADDQRRLEPLLIDNKRGTIAKQASDQVFFGYDPADPKKSLKELQDEAVQAVGKYTKGDAALADTVKQKVATDWARENTNHRQGQQQLQIGFDGILTGLKTEGNRKPTSVEEFKAAPGGQELWEKANDTQRKRIMHGLELNAKPALKQSSQEEWVKLKGMAATDPVKFLAEDVANNPKLTPADQRQFVSMQQKMTEKAEMDPRVRQALNLLGPDMKSANIGKSINENRYYQFVGALQDAIMTEQGDAKRPLKPEEVRKIGARIMQEQGGYQLFGMRVPFTGDGTFFERQMPEKDRQIMQDQWYKRFDTPPTDAQLQRLWTRIQYKKLYGKSAPAKDESKPNQPQAPASE